MKEEEEEDEGGRRRIIRRRRRRRRSKPRYRSTILSRGSLVSLPFVKFVKMTRGCFFIIYHDE